MFVVVFKKKDLQKEKKIKIVSNEVILRVPFQFFLEDRENKYQKINVVLLKKIYFI